MKREKEDDSWERRKEGVLILPKRNATIFDEKRHEIERFRTLKFVKLNIVVDNGN